MSNLLFIAYDFPPLNSGGSRRSFRFAKSLSRMGNQVHVLSPSLSSYPSDKLDSDLESELGASELVIHRVPLANKTIYQRWMGDKHILDSVDSTYKRWESGLKIKLPELLKQESIDIVIISIPPFSLSKVLLKLLEANEIPVVVDFRDAWSQWILAPYFSWINYKMILALEKKVLRTASAVITTSHQTTKDLCSIHPGFQQKIHTIYNSYDGKLSVLQKQLKLSAQQDKVKIGYVGSFYFNEKSHSMMMDPWWKKAPHQFLQYVPRRENWRYRTPYFFFKILNDLFAEDSSLKNRVEVTFAGKKDSWFDEMVRSFSLVENVKHVGVLKANEALDFQKRCDVLLLTSSKVIGGRDYSIAGKTFEYFKIGKPVIGVLPEGAQKDLMEKAGNTLLCDPDDTSSSKELIKEFLLGNTYLEPDWDYIEEFDSVKSAQKLNRILKSLKV